MFGLSNRIFESCYMLRINSNYHFIIISLIRNLIKLVSNDPISLARYMLMTGIDHYI